MVEDQIKTEKGIDRHRERQMERDSQQRKRDTKNETESRQGQM